MKENAHQNLVIRVYGIYVDGSALSATINLAMFIHKHIIYIYSFEIVMKIQKKYKKLSEAYHIHIFIY